MSKNTKNILIILTVAVVFCVLAVVAAIGSAGLLADRFKDNITVDKPKIQKMAHEFMNYELPAGYSENMGMDFVIYKMILIGDSENSTAKPMIFLTHFQATNGMSPEQMSQQMQKSVEQQSGQKGLKMKLVETRNVTINGEETPLNVSEGDDSSGESYRQWVVTFNGKTGLVILLVQGKTAEWDDAVLNEFLASISK